MSRRQGVGYGEWLDKLGADCPRWHHLRDALSAVCIPRSTRVMLHRPGVLRVCHWSGATLGYIDVLGAVWLAETDSIAA